MRWWVQPTQAVHNHFRPTAGTVSPSNQNDGFTLVELLVAFAVLALVLGYFVQSVQLSARSTMRVDNMKETVEAVEAIIAEQLPQLGPGGTLTGVTEEGINWQVEAVSGGNAIEQQAGLNRYEIVLSSADGSANQQRFRMVFAR